MCIFKNGLRGFFLGGGRILRAKTLRIGERSWKTANPAEKGFREARRRRV
ncbi:hypothetical protein LEP1GSC035_0300 [Leptospira noguchii str. 2007001578]|uniref:Uncharacterized protein n=1 Tax=Leptospira noguchii str. 2007001578 TaxID=1049974 RepID=A0ABP2TBS6_9LEPT|nr:hypothetical protein LEP1GSC035_0300 [Leptospira noguchii str. 2007001578]